MAKVEVKRITIRWLVLLGWCLLLGGVLVTLTHLNDPLSKTSAILTGTMLLIGACGVTFAGSVLRVDRAIVEVGHIKSAEVPRTSDKE